MEMQVILVGYQGKHNVNLDDLYQDEIHTIERLGRAMDYNPQAIEEFKQVHRIHFEYEHSLSQLLPEMRLKMIASNPARRKELERTAESHGNRTSREAVKALARDRTHSDFVNNQYLLKFRPLLDGGNA